MIFSILYPFTIVFMPWLTHLIIAILAALWMVKFYKSKEWFDCFVGMFFMIIFLFLDLKFIYPVIINMGLFFAFLLSLKTTPIITKIALLKKPNLDEEGKIYTRNLTKIWICFFLLNATISLVLWFLEDKSMWAIYCGVISYMLIGFLFFTEILYRRYILKV